MTSGEGFPTGYALVYNIYGLVQCAPEPCKGCLHRLREEDMLAVLNGTSGAQ
jgi:hypothetical protein